MNHCGPDLPYLPAEKWLPLPLIGPLKFLGSTVEDNS